MDTISTKGCYAKSWPRVSKAAAVTEVARESISVAGNVTSELVPSTTSLTETSKSGSSRSIQLTKKDWSSGRSLPADTATTKIHIASNGSASTASEPPQPATAPDLQPHNTKDGNESSNQPGEDGKESKDAQDITSRKPPGTAADTQDGPDDTLRQSDQPAGWFHWLTWSTPVDKDHLNIENSEPLPAESTGSPSGEACVISELEPTQADRCIIKPDQRPSSNEDRTSTAQNRPWLQMWGGSPVPFKEERLEETKQETRLEASQSSSEGITNVLPAISSAENDGLEGSQAKRLSTANKTSGWAFWSRDVPKNAELGLSQEAQSKEPVSGANMQVIEMDPGIQNTTAKGIPKNKTPKDTQEAATASTSTATFDVPGSPTLVKATASEMSASKQLQRALSHQLLPSFRDTFTFQESPSLLQTIGRFLRYSKETGHRHVALVRDPPRPKKALAIGVHGYFPAPFFRTVLGQPTGTSVKFANMAAKAIHRWAENHNYRCEVEKISLEGDGRIVDRVDSLWKLLLNWMEDLRKADFILIACHSQGVPVTVMLVAKLISFGCLNSTRIGICAMAGVNLGPFPDYKSRWIGGSAGELFEFAQADSRVSQEYDTALRNALDFGIRISFVGSIDDQLVSLEVMLPCNCFKVVFGCS
jgi:hypothetical protein